jgi:flagellar P-ring protein FlgI
MLRPRATLVLLAMTALSIPGAGRAERIKDLATVQGVRSNQLIGYGLVVGLKGTGDTQQARFTLQSLAAMLGRLGVRIDPRDIQVRNVAAVVVTTELPPFAKTGTRIDLSVSSIGNARSLVGGTLVFTPLKAADGEVYAVGQGPLSVGGFDLSSGGASVSKNHTTVGRIPQGGTVEREVAFSLEGSSELRWNLETPDFTLAARVAEVMNTALATKAARAVDPGTIALAVPAERADQLVQLVAELEVLEVQADSRARVVVNERTGTVILGEKVRISTVALAHGNLQLEVRPERVASQPAPFSRGDTVVVQEDKLEVTEDGAAVRLVEGGATLAELVRALNAIGASPRDLIDILLALRAAGALHASLEIL